MSARLSALAASCLVLTACRQPIGRGWDWNRMREQPRTTSYGASAAFPNGMAMQHEPEGAVASAPDSLSVPANDSDRGRERFHIFCAVCHGERADGNSLVASNMDPPRPPSLVTGAASTLPITRIDSVIRFGYGKMMGFGSDIPDADRDALIAYLLRLRAATP